jgi:hypothetical protein
MESGALVTAFGKPLRCRASAPAAEDRIKSELTMWLQ